ncbi:hypothetical protein [Arenimonas composti]|uniref:N-acetyltransferase domain-containing protein n=1 Tax=Arenimonas composti TR7-09 = DSM 18010 TaxID=1121013 RepID=A0A091BBQ3_9GAMM|nr:hypothetical protein [Arenimonas composti]KFN50078.1 hypothetical protein P873_00875 [Arenimonas composti TR7-09 = DSM 18010]
MSIEIIPVWKKVDDALREELLAFWTENKAISDPDIARRRAPQAVCISRNAEGRITGVATCGIRVLPRLRQPMYYYRHFFAPEIRGQHLTKPFANKVKEVLQDYNAGLEKPEALGILAELQSKQLDSAYARAYHPDVDFTFIGYSPRGSQLLVSYFKDARLGPPAPIKRAAAPAGGSGA